MLPWKKKHDMYMRTDNSDLHFNLSLFVTADSGTDAPYIF